MSIREITMYQIACDAPGCEISTADNFSEHFAWSDKYGAESDWEADGDSLITENGKHYCGNHWKWCPGCEAEQIPAYEGAAELCASCVGAS